MINEDAYIVASKPKTNFDMDDTSIMFQGQNVNKMSNDTNSQKTQGNGSLSTRTKDEEDDFNLSFEDDIFLDLQKGDFLLDEE